MKLSSVLRFLALWFDRRLFLRTNAGRDFQSRQMGDTAHNGTGTYAACNFIAVTEDAGAPAAGDTTLAGELTGEGFARAQGIYAHTAGTTTYTITKTFTMSSGTSRTLNKAGMFNAGSSGTMAFETLIPSPPTLVPSDQITLTWTINIA